jgi:hypothetical protein
MIRGREIGFRRVVAGLSTLLALAGCGEGETPPLVPIPDTVAPVVVIVLPERDTTNFRTRIPTPETPVQAVATDTVGVVRATYQLNGQSEVEVPITPGTSALISFTVHLTADENEIVVYAYDAAGNRASSEVRRLREDHLGPQIQILSPDTSGTLTTPTVTLRLHVSDASGVDRITYQMNYGFIFTAPIGDTAQTIEVEYPIDPGPSRIDVKAYDAYGNQSGQTVSFRRGGLRFSDVSVGQGGEFCGLDVGGSIFCEGDQYRLRQAGGDRTYLSVATGLSGACAIASAGSLYCWTYSFGSPPRVPGTETPVQLLAGTEFSAVSASSERACAISRSGELFCWGAGGQPEQIPGGPYSAISVNATSSCALDSSGQAFCWGKNASGQLGNGTTTDAAAPTPVATDLRFRAIAAGYEHTCAVALDGGAYCWGNNQLGQLGTGSVSTAATPVTTPVAVAGGLRFSSITAGSTHSCALGQDGRAYCWGDNAWGQLGTGDNIAHPSPTQVVGGITWSRLSTSYRRGCGVSTDHRLYCWGSGPLVPELQIGQ